MAAARVWDIFCKVIDNFVGHRRVLRLAADLASRGHTVRLWVDDARPCAGWRRAGAKGSVCCLGPQDGAPLDLDAAGFAQTPARGAGRSLRLRDRA